LQVVFFVNSGTEANELATMMARLYTGNHDMISVRNGYHGNSANTMGLTSQSKWKFNIVQVCKLKPHVWKLLLERKEISVPHGCLGL
jgi:4-aminobutyrate aminotransferase-like enzyme